MLRSEGHVGKAAILGLVYQPAELTISRRPSLLAAPAIIAATGTMRPPSRTSDSSHPTRKTFDPGPVAFERTFEEGLHAPVDFLAQFRDLALRDAGKPIACAISSTRRVDTPPIQASWMTATNAFSAVLRAAPCPRVSR